MRIHAAAMRNAQIITEVISANVTMASLAMAPIVVDTKLSRKSYTGKQPEVTANKEGET